MVFAEFTRARKRGSDISRRRPEPPEYSRRSQGVIKEVYVKEGQQVTEGQPVLRVATDQLTGSGEDVNALTLGILTSRKDALSRQIKAEQQRLISEGQQLTVSLSNLTSEASLLTSQIANQTRRIQLGETLVSAGSTLATKGLLSDTEFKHRRRAILGGTRKELLLWPSKKSP